MYHVTITKKVENPNYETEKAELLKREEGSYRYGRETAIPLRSEYGDKLITEKVLEVQLTDAEFAAVKKGVLEVM